LRGPVEVSVDALHQRRFDRVLPVGFIKADKVLLTPKQRCCCAEHKDSAVKHPQVSKKS
jgi:hypothetical protein